MKKKLLAVILCLGMFVMPVTTWAADYSIKLPEGWEGEDPNYHKTANPASRLTVSEVSGTLDEIISQGDEYITANITNVENMVTIIGLHATTYANVPAATASVFGTIDGSPVVVQNDLVSCPDGGLLSFKYYYTDDNKDYYQILDSLTFGSGAETPASDSADPTVGEQNALKAAKNYLSLMSFSYTGLIKQLTSFDGYTETEATYAADNCEADWNEQAAKAAKNYTDLMSFSRSGLIEQLVQFDGFTEEQAEYAANQIGY